MPIYALGRRCPCQTRELPAKGVERLKALVLVEERGAGLRLTPIGMQRYLALPNSGAIYEAGSHKFISKMADFMTNARG
jgi:hypothetical protein